MKYFLSAFIHLTKVLNTTRQWELEIGAEVVVRAWDMEEKGKEDSQSHPSRHIQFIYLFIHLFVTY